MITGLAAGALWGLDTVILSIALSRSGFCSTAQALALAPFVSTFLHDFFSSCWMILYTTVRRKWKNVLYALKTKSGKFIILGALLGGPVGMSGYVAAINFIGPAYTAVITAVYPAMGALLARIFLKEKMKKYQVVSLLVCIAGVIILGYSPAGSGDVKNFYIGFACAVLCVLGWSSEAVICAHGMKDPAVTNEQALQIRQVISAAAYAAVILPIIKGWHFTADIFLTSDSGIILISALCGTASYLFYYKTISSIGASKAMALNITYSAWSIVFSLILLRDQPDIKAIICCIMIAVSSVITGMGDIKGKKNKEIKQ